MFLRKFSICLSLLLTLGFSLSGLTQPKSIDWVKICNDRRVQNCFNEFFDNCMVVKTASEKRTTGCYPTFGNINPYSQYSETDCKKFQSQNYPMHWVVQGETFSCVPK